MEAAFAKLGTIEKKFVYTQDVFHPKADLAADNVRINYLSLFLNIKIFVTKSYDATTHFETTSEDIIRVYKEVTGKDFDFSACKVSLIFFSPDIYV